MFLSLSLSSVFICHILMRIFDSMFHFFYHLFGFFFCLVSHPRKSTNTRIFLVVTQVRTNKQNIVARHLFICVMAVNLYLLTFIKCDIKFYSYFFFIKSRKYGVKINIQFDNGECNSLRRRRRRKRKKFHNDLFCSISFVGCTKSLCFFIMLLFLCVVCTIFCFMTFKIISWQTVNYVRRGDPLSLARSFESAILSHKTLKL